MSLVKCELPVLVPERRTRWRASALSPLSLCVDGTGVDK